MKRLVDVERILEPYKILRNTDTLCVATIRQNILECPTVEAIPKSDYESRLKDDMVAILTELQQEIDGEAWTRECLDGSDERIVEMESVNEVIQQKINNLKES